MVNEQYNKNCPLASHFYRALVCGTLILLTGCAHQNRSATTETPIPEETPTAVESAPESAEDEAAHDTVAPVVSDDAAMAAGESSDASAAAPEIAAMPDSEGMPGEPEPTATTLLAAGALDLPDSAEVYDWAGAWLDEPGAAPPASGTRRITTARSGLLFAEPVHGQRIELR